MIEGSLQTLKLGSTPPGFSVYSPFRSQDEVARFKAGDSSLAADLDSRLFEKIEKHKPDHVTVDTLNSFMPEIVEKRGQTRRYITRFRQIVAKHECSLDLIHHPRKEDREKPPPPLVTNPRAWFDEASGMKTLINLVDVRVGVILEKDDVLTLGGFARGSGDLTPRTLARIYDSQGRPIGYKMLNSLDTLTPRLRDVIFRLPSPPTPFSFEDIRLAVLATSTTGRGDGKSTASDYKKRLLTLGLMEEVKGDPVPVGRPHPVFILRAPDEAAVLH